MLQSVLLKTTRLDNFDQDTSDLELRYFLIIDEYVDQDLPVHTGYGISIKLCSTDGVLDEKTVADIETSKEKMETMISYFSDQVVTPVSLLYVLEDTLGVPQA